MTFLTWCLKSNLMELYTLKFIKSKKVVCTNEMLEPQLRDRFDEQTVAVCFRKFNRKCDVMHENGFGFRFGQQFYGNLSRLLAQIFLCNFQSKTPKDIE